MNAAKNRAAVLARLRMEPYDAALKRAGLDRALAQGMDSDDPHERVGAFLGRVRLMRPDYGIDERRRGCLWN